jgi:serine/threonine protein kinase
MHQIFLKRYQVDRLLGQGRMGQVYLARQLDLDRLVALRVVPEALAGNVRFQESFQRETPRLLRFQHPFAVAYYDASLHDPQGPCLVMEYIRGVPLGELCRLNKGRLSPGRVARLLTQLCEVLQAAHNGDLIHGELKPADILIVDADTPFEKVKVMDLGMTRLRDSIGKPGPIPGANAYLSPERFRGQPLDHRADLYSVGVIIHELLTGKIPGNCCQAGETTAPARTSRTSPSALPPAVEAVVLACLEPDPAQRLGSALELAELFSTALAQPGPISLPASPRVGQAFQPDGTSQAGRPDLLSEGPGQQSGPDAEQQVLDQDAVVYQMEAWLPQAIAEHKVRGFVQETGGAILESIPGLIRVRLGEAATKYELKKGMFSWFDRRTGLVEMFLRFQTGKRQNQVIVTVLIRSLDGESVDDAEWQARCTEIYHDLRGYLMGRDRDTDKK